MKMKWQNMLKITPRQKHSRKDSSTASFVPQATEKDVKCKEIKVTSGKINHECSCIILINYIN